MFADRFSVFSQIEARGQAQGEANKQLSHKDLGEEPHGEVHVVFLDVKVVPVPRHVERGTGRS